jgi:hypothetical protein
MLPVHGPSGSPAFRSGTPDTPGRPAQPAVGGTLRSAHRRSFSPGSVASFGAQQCVPDGRLRRAGREERHCLGRACSSRSTQRVAEGRRAMSEGCRGLGTVR